MKTSESITTIAGALLKAQKEMEGAKKDSKNPFFKSKYSDFNSVLEAVKGPLNNNGISILQPHRVDCVENKQYMVVETILLHESGEFLSSETQVVVAKANDPQSLGSAQTYARRYGLQSLTALPSEDDDGEKGMNRTAKPANKQASKPTASKPAASGFGGSGSVVDKKVDAKPVVNEEAKVPSRTGSFGG